MIAISIYVMIAALPENRLGLIAIPLTAFGLGIFTINSELKLDSVYPAARENAVISHDALTLATVTESGETAIESLRKIANSNSPPEKALGHIYNSFAVNCNRQD